MQHGQWKQCAVLAAAGHSQMKVLSNKQNGKILQFFIKLLSGKKISRNLNFKLLTTSRPMVTICTNTETLQHFAIKIVYVFCMSLTINSLYFSRQYQTPGLSKASRLCSLQGSNWSSKCVIQMSIKLQRVKKKNINKQTLLYIWRFVRRQLLYMKIIYLIDWGYHKQCCHFEDFFFGKCIYCNTNSAVPSTAPFCFPL